jgi:hypothetical protein
MRDLAIRNTHPTVVSIMDGVKATNANGDLVELNETLITAEINRLQLEENANAYKEARALAYAPLAEQLDMQYHDTMNGTETWLDHIRSVKEAHPKEGE